MLLSGLTFAHKVSIFASEQNGVVDVYGYFSDGTPAKKSDVEVYDAVTGKLLLKGKTDENGLFEFKVPAGEKELRIVLYAGLGHKAVQTLQVNTSPQQTPSTANESGNRSSSATPSVTNKTEIKNSGGYSLKIPAGVEKVEIVFYYPGGEKTVYTFEVGGRNSQNPQKVVKTTDNTGGQIVKPTANEEKRELSHIRQIVNKETAFPWGKVFCGIGWILGIFGAWDLIARRLKKKTN